VGVPAKNTFLSVERFLQLWFKLQGDSLCILAWPITNFTLYISARKMRNLHENPLAACGHLAAKSVLSLLTLIWHTNPEDCLFQGTAPFLKSIMIFLRNHPRESQITAMYCGALLTALSALGAEHASGSAGGIDFMQEEYIWMLAMRYGRSDFTIACGYRGI
jgi:hypothetical protein